MATSVPLNAVVMAVLFSAGVGIFFGFYPARKAAGLDPIDALRFE
jgi:ABC-type antimicrobial peptide transport system permease subunit